MTKVLGKVITKVLGKVMRKMGKVIKDWARSRVP